MIAGGLSRFGGNHKKREKIKAMGAELGEVRSASYIYIEDRRTVGAWLARRIQEAVSPLE